MCRLNRKRKRATEQFVARPGCVLVQPDANPSSQFSSRLQIGLGKGTASAVPIRPNRRWALAPEERASRTRWTPFKSVQNYWVFRSPLCTVILSMTTTALSSKKWRHCSCALAAAVKGAPFAFISTLDSGGKGNIIETGWKRSVSQRSFHHGGTVLIFLLTRPRKLALAKIDSVVLTNHLFGLNRDHDF